MADLRLTPAFPTDLATWQALETHYQKDMRSKSLETLFKLNRARAEGYSLEAGDLFLEGLPGNQVQVTELLLTQQIQEFPGGEVLDETGQVMLLSLS